MRQHVPVALLCSLPLLIWTLCNLHPRNLAVPLSGIILIAALCSAHFAWHLHQVNTQTAELRSETHLAAAAIQKNANAHSAVWLDPRIGIGSDALATAAQYRLWLLRYELPQTPVEFSQGNQPVNRGDFLLTFQNFPHQSPLWSNGALALYQLN